MYAGIPLANLSAAKAITLPGYAADVARGARNRGRNLVTMNRAFQVALRSGPIDASQVEMHRALATTYYKVLGKPSGMSGLGDDIDELTELMESGWEPSPPPSSEGGSTWWSNILGTFAGAIGLGVAGRIAGHNPWAKPPTVVTAPEMPAIAKVALVGGGVIAGAYVLSRVLRK